MLRSDVGKVVAGVLTVAAAVVAILAYLTPLIGVSSAVVVVVVLIVAAIVVAVLTRPRQPAIDKRLHSARLNDEVLKPWTHVTILHKDDRTFYLQAESPVMTDEPTYRWAVAHLRTAYPEIWRPWSESNSTVTKANAMISNAKKLLRQRIRVENGQRFHNRVRPLEEYEPRQWDVCYLATISNILWDEIFRVLKYPDTEPEFGLTSLPVVEQGQAGYEVKYAGTQIVKARSANAASKEGWESLMMSLGTDAQVRTALRSIQETIAEAEAKLGVFRKGLTELVKRIENGIPIQGECDVEQGGAS